MEVVVVVVVVVAITIVRVCGSCSSSGLCGSGSGRGRGRTRTRSRRRSRRRRSRGRGSNSSSSSGRSKALGAFAARSRIVNACSGVLEGLNGPALVFTNHVRLPKISSRMCPASLWHGAWNSFVLMVFLRTGRFSGLCG